MIAMQPACLKSSSSDQIQRCKSPTEAEMQMSGQGVRWRSSEVKPFNWCVCGFSSPFCCFHRVSALCIGGSGSRSGKRRKGHHQGGLSCCHSPLFRFQLHLSAQSEPSSVSLCLCASLSLLTHVFYETTRSFFSFLVRICTLPPRHSALTVSEIFLLHSGVFIIALIRLPSVLPYAQSVPEFNT